jgi:hypothetical protein
MTNAITNTAHGAYTQPTNKQPKSEAKDTGTQATTSAASPNKDPQDKVEFNGNAIPDKPNTYNKPTGSPTKSSPGEIDSILAESQRKADEFLSLIRSLITKQGLEFSKVVRGEQKLTVEDPKLIEDAKTAIALDGEYGVKKTAENILNFAKSLMNADPSKMDLIRNAIQKGFDAAKGILGGELPEISKKTYDVIMKELDRWQKDGIPTDDINVTID